MGKGAALLGLCPVRQGQGGGLCATCGPLRGVCKRGLGCETPRPHTSGARAIWRFLSPHPENRGYRKHSHPHRWTSEEKPPRSSGPSRETGLHAPGDRSPCQTTALLATLCMCPGRPGPSQAWARTWAQPGLCLRAPAVSPAGAGAGPALFALSQPGPCVPDPRASSGREGIREVDGRVEAGRGSRCKVRAWWIDRGGMADAKKNQQNLVLPEREFRLYSKQ